MREVLVGAICAIAVFLVSYKGYQKRDTIAAKVAGFSALAIALFPTAERSREASDTGVRAPDSVTFFSGADAADPAIIGKVHFISATVFFLTLAVMSLFLFTISTKPAMTDEKKQRNKVYVACGVTMVACIVLIAAGKFFMSREWNDQTSFMFWLESIAVVAFGISWLTKAEVILADSVVTT
jgi:NADH:ubiquinone oxidoreductase subunit 6 (subunit J)